MVKIISVNGEHLRSERRATVRWLGLLYVCLVRVKANAKKSGKVDFNRLGLEGRATARRLGSSSNGREKEHTSEKKGETEMQMPLDETRPEDLNSTVQGKIRTGNLRARRA